MARAGVILSAHALVYVVLIAAAGRCLLFGALGLRLRESALDGSPLLIIHAKLLASGITAGISMGIVVGVITGIAKGIARGIAIGIISVVAMALPLGSCVHSASWRFEWPVEFNVWINTFTVLLLLGGIVVNIFFPLIFETTYAIFARTKFGITLAIAEGICIGIYTGFFFGITQAITMGITGGTAMGIGILRAYYYPWHLMLLIFAPTTDGYRWHPVVWDDMCRLPFVGLDRFLLALWNTDPVAGGQEIERLISSYPSQRMEALKARAAAIAREAANASLSRIDEIVNRLPEGKKQFLAEAPQVREKVAEIAATQRLLDTVDRPFLRHPYARAVLLQVDNFRSQISGFHEPLASEFSNAASAWLTRAQIQLEQITKITGREPAPQVFRAGDPVDRSREAFVPRMSVIGQIERQIALATGCPGLLIYGRRRMGKSTLIRNLDGFVPETVRIVSFSMQNPAAFSSTAHFVRLIGQKLRADLSGEISPLESEDLYGLFEHLTGANTRLEKAGRRVVLAIDEFEHIDQKIGEGVFSSDLLATIREFDPKSPPSDLGFRRIAPDRHAKKRAMALLPCERPDHPGSAVHGKRNTPPPDRSLDAISPLYGGP